MDHMFQKNRKLINLLALLCLFSFNHAKAATSKHGMVVSAQHLATQVGLYILKKGGNAVDAAVAMGYALAVVEPCCGNIGGGGFMMLALSNGTKTVINFREKAPMGLNRQLLENTSNPYLTIGIPGTVKGLNAALKHYGSMPLKQVIQPAITLAEKGFILKAQDVQFLRMDTPSFQRQQNVAEIFLNSGRPYKIGERLTQKQLGQTLRLIAEQGDHAFYQGSIAQELVRAIQKNGGVLTLADLNHYKISFEKPLTCNYRGYQVMTTPPPSAGGMILCQLLTTIEGFSLQDYSYNAIKTLGINLDAIKYIYQNKNIFQMAGRTTSQAQQLISEFQPEEIRKKIQHHIRPQSQHPALEFGKNLNTTSYLVADSKGNLVAVTYTLDDAFGAKVIAGNTGFFLNNELGDFAYGKSNASFLKKFGNNINNPMPNKAPISFITQVLLLNNKKPFLMLASPGGDTIPTQMLIAIENFIDYKMSLQNTVNAPRYHFRWEKNTVHLEPEWISQGKKLALQTMGYKIGIGSGTQLNLPYWGAIAAIYKTNSGELQGAMDRRRPAGMARGY